MTSLSSQAVRHAFKMRHFQTYYRKGYAENHIPISLFSVVKMRSESFELKHFRSACFKWIIGEVRYQVLKKFGIRGT